MQTILPRPVVRHIDAEVAALVDAWVAAIVAAGSSVSTMTRLAAYDFVLGCKADGTWDLLYMADLRCGADLTAALIRLKVPTGVSRAYTNINFVSGDYTERGASGGMTGNGSSKYLNSGINPVLRSYSESSFSMWCYTRTTAAGGTSQVTMGTSSTGTGAQSTLLGWVATGSIEGGSIAGNNVAGAEYAGRLTPSVAGFHGVTTNGSSTATYYLNGNAQAETRTQTSTFISDQIPVHCARNSSVPAAYSSRTLSSTFIGSGFSAAQAAALYRRVQDFETALGRNV